MSLYQLNIEKDDFNTTEGNKSNYHSSDEENGDKKEGKKFNNFDKNEDKKK